MLYNVFLSWVEIAVLWWRAKRSRNGLPSGVCWEDISCLPQQLCLLAALAMWLYLGDGDKQKRSCLLKKEGAFSSYGAMRKVEKLWFSEKYEMLWFVPQESHSGCLEYQYSVLLTTLPQLRVRSQLPVWGRRALSLRLETEILGPC